MKNFYGRRCSRRLNKNEIALLNQEDFFFHEKSAKNKIGFLKRNFRNFNLEIGFGTGDNLIDQAISLPHEGFIGCDPFMDGNIFISRKLKSLSIKNIIFTNLVFEDLFNFILEIYFSKIFILFPDPWEKRKHNKRRLVNNKFTKNLSKIIKPNGKVFILTDHHDYQKEILLSFKSNDCFEHVEQLKNNKEKYFQNIFETKYYKKAISKKTNIHHNLFKLV